MEIQGKGGTKNIVDPCVPTAWSSRGLKERNFTKIFPPLLHQVDVVGDNVHAPVMKHTSCHITINPSHVQTRVVTLEAVDEDINSHLTYHLDTPHQDVSLDPLTGVLMLNRPINTSSISFRVVASDGLHNSSTVRIVIEVRLM